MAKKPRGRTFADLAKEPTWGEAERSRSGEHAVRPGMFNRGGEFFDPSGRLLVLKQQAVGPAEAVQRVSDGALVAFEGCGCGGWAGCAPEWFTGDRLLRLRTGPGPRFVRGHGAPTWIDVWASGAGEVVFAHGEVDWAGEPG
jgi:hypothetical protein